MHMPHVRDAGRGIETPGSFPSTSPGPGSVPVTRKPWRNCKAASYMQDQRGARRNGVIHAHARQRPMHTPSMGT